MIQLLAMLILDLVILLAVGDAHVAALGVAALTAGVAGGLAASGAPGEMLGRIRLFGHRLRRASLGRAALAPFATGAIQLVVLPTDVRQQLLAVAEAGQTTVAALILEAIRDRIWLEGTLQDAEEHSSTRLPGSSGNRS